MCVNAGERERERGCEVHAEEWISRKKNEHGGRMAYIVEIIDLRPIRSLSRERANAASGTWLCDCRDAVEALGGPLRLR
jgi:hypothetical protein